MPRRTPNRAGFTLMEAVLSVGILAFALVVIIGALGTAARMTAQDQHQQVALELLHDCFTDLASATARHDGRSPVFHLDVPAAPAKAGLQQLWFDVDGRRLPDEAGAFFRCDLAIHPDANPSLAHLHGHVRWPARATGLRPDGEAELLTSIALP